MVERLHKLSEPVRDAVNNGTALLLRIRAGVPEEQRFLLRIGREEWCLNYEGEITEPVPYDDVVFTPEDIVRF